MKRILKMIASAIVFMIALSIIAISILPRITSSSGINEDETQSVSERREVLGASTLVDSEDYDKNIFFTTVNDYLDYLSIYSTEDASYDTSEIYHWAVENMPTDAELVHILVDGESTTFNYYLEREYDAMPETTSRDTVTNVIDVYSGDELIEGLLHAVIQKDYNLNATNITDTGTFAENLAEKLGCELDTQINYAIQYTGSVYVRDHSTGTLPQVYLVGHQTIIYTYVPNQPEKIVYAYVPVSLSSTEQSTLFNTIDYYLCDSIIND